MGFAFGNTPKKQKPKTKRTKIKKPRVSISRKKFAFGKGKKQKLKFTTDKNKRPKGTRSEKRAPKMAKKPASYQYSIVQSKDTRVRTFRTREEAVIDLNKKRESQPGHKYRIVTEKKPEYKMF